jgi:hypothetical protein
MKRISALVLFIFLALGFLFINNAKADQATHLVISEVQIAGGSATDEFIEIYNPTSTNQNLEGWKITKKTALGVDELLIANLSGTISAKGYFLIAHSDYDGSVSADISYSTESISTNNSILLKDNNDNTIDILGLGTAATKETTTIANPQENRSVERKALSTSQQLDMAFGGIHHLFGNSEDTNNNSIDFVRHGSPFISTPQNSASEIESLPQSPTPTPSPTEEPTPTPTESPTPTPMPSLTPTSTPTPTMSPTPTIEPTAIPSISPTLSISPSPTPKVISNGPLFRCTLNYISIAFMNQTVRFPKISCTSN